MKTPKIYNRYTPDKLKAILKSIELQVIEDTDIYYLTQPLGSRGINSNQWYKFKKIIEGDKEGIATINRIEALLENRLVVGALNNKINTTMSIFLLKNKYNYKDSKQIDSNITITPILSGLSNTPLKDDTKVIDID